MKVPHIKLIGIFLFTFLIFDTSAQSNFREVFRNLREIVFNAIGRSINEPRLLQQAENQHRIQKRMPTSIEFPCRNPSNGGKKSNLLPWNEVRSKTRPTSAHMLRPGDIDVVGAMGDSLTAANGAGASNVFQVYIENRGVSWSIGGQGTWREYFTLPNILKEFNPKLVGYSLGDGLGHQRVTQFNTAEIGAMSRDLPHMARELVKRMKNDPRVDIQNDWKLITIMIGPNDFCIDVCFHKSPIKVVERHREELLIALRTLRDNLPRTLVNVVPAPNVEILKSFQRKPPMCDMLHLLQCPCFFGEGHRYQWPLMREIIKRWQQIDYEADTLSEFDSKEDFAVVVQPFDLDITFPMLKNGQTDFSYLSTDCFHFSQKGYARAANALWNNMMEPVGNKSTNWRDIYETVLCPTIDQPYIYTRKNSMTSHRSSIYNDGNDINSNLLKRNAPKNIFN